MAEAVGRGVAIGEVNLYATREGVNRCSPTGQGSEGRGGSMSEKLKAIYNEYIEKREAIDAEHWEKVRALWDEYIEKRKAASAGE